jgi:hypothetical protein
MALVYSKRTAAIIVRSESSAHPAGPHPLPPAYDGFTRTLNSVASMTPFERERIQMTVLARWEALPAHEKNERLNRVRQRYGMRPRETYGPRREAQAR